MEHDMDASQYLSSKGIQVFRANGAEVTFHCLWCPDGDARGKGKCYLNAESWLYDCKRCGERGNRKTLYRHFGDEDETVFEPGQDPAARRAVLEAATDVSAEMLVNNQHILDYLKGRGLTLQTIVDYRLGYVPKSWSLCASIEGARADKINSGMMTQSGRDFFSDRITIPYLQRGQVIQVRGKDPNGKYFTPAGDSVRLFNADKLAGAEDVIITEGEFDCLVLQQQLETAVDPRTRRIAVVGIPGAGSLPAGFEGYFSECRRVFIALDPDEVGKKSAIKIKEILGSKARIVELPETLPKCDWSEFIAVRKHGLSDILELLSNASGKRLWSVSDAGAKWRRRRNEGSADGIKFGFAELDAWFAPGMEAGDLIIPLAKTGVGKTNFLINVAFNTRLRPTLMITMEMMSWQIYDRLRRVYHFHYPLATDLEIDEAFSNLRIVDENKIREGDITAMCEEYEQELGFRPQFTMVDYVGYYAKGCKGVGAYEKTTNAVMNLKAEGKYNEIAMLAPHQVNRAAIAGKPLEDANARDSGAVEETADLLLSLYRPDEAIEGSNESVPSGLVRCGVLKNRKGGKGMATNIMFSAASLALVDANTPAAKIIEEENRMIWRGDSYPTVRSMRQAMAMKNQQQLSLVS
jgi:hypothetical protein